MSIQVGEYMLMNVQPGNMTSVSLPDGFNVTGEYMAVVTFSNYLTTVEQNTSIVRVYPSYK